MEKLNKHWLVKFRHELSRLEIGIIEETRYKQNIYFVLKHDILLSHEIYSLMKIHDFSISLTYHEDRLRLKLMLYDND